MADLSRQKFLVDTKLPYAGLGNMLLVWARAVVFAELNSLPMFAPMWQSFHIGPWLRQERCKRYYGQFFSSKYYAPPSQGLIAKVSHNKVIHHNPDIVKIDLSAKSFAVGQQHTFVFDQMPPWNDYFQDLKEHQNLVKEKLYSDVRPKLLAEILNKPAPQIGIHIRRGDYGKPDAQNDFKVNRCVYTPLEWYVGVLKKIRQEIGNDVPATIFSDGYPEELTDILSMPNVMISPETSALSDMITMSRSKVLIGSAHSSFSAWASYLGQCPTIWQSDRHHLYEPIFTPDVKKSVYEGSLDPFADGELPTLLHKNLSQLFAVT
jgi:Glycosyl transferase family 11